MPTPKRQLDRSAVDRHLLDAVFGAPRNRSVGLELEWLTRTRTGGRPPIGHLEELVADVLPRLPRGGGLTIEPGGQLELSTQPFADTVDACEAAATDLHRLEHACVAEGIDLIALGHDPDRPPECVREDVPRYGAMIDYFADRWPDAIAMMANTASIQLNVGLGTDDDELQRRWHLANALGPVLIGAFANSPFADGRPTGWASTRWARWASIDPGRTALPDLSLPPVDAWRHYVWDAPVMLVCAAPDQFAPQASSLPFGRWVDEGHDLGWPTLDDLDYHLTTLFPPVRPRGWFELRYLDALPTPFWQVAATVVTRVLDDEALGRAASDALGSTTSLWDAAPAEGLNHPELAAAARRLFELVLDDLRHTRPDSASEAVVQTYFDHWVARGRTPADDRLDVWRRTGEVVPRAESPIPYAAFEQIEP